jgi:metal-responsive CopG/Arc/MetJ family transcriptional regulator
MKNENEMPKQRITISISKECLEWIDKQIEKRIYKDRSHAIEKLIYDKKHETKE